MKVKVVHVVKNFLATFFFTLKTNSLLVANMIFSCLVRELAFLALDIFMQADSMREILSEAIQTMLTIFTVKIIVNMSAE